jgi:hypothetical protein
MNNAAGRGRDPADQEPVAGLVLGQDPHRLHRGDGQGLHPGDVVGHDQDTVAEPAGTDPADADAHRAQQHPGRQPHPARPHPGGPGEQQRRGQRQRDEHPEQQR